MLAERMLLGLVTTARAGSAQANRRFRLVKACGHISSIFKNVAADFSLREEWGLQQDFIQQRTKHEERSDQLLDGRLYLVDLKGFA